MSRRRTQGEKLAARAVAEERQEQEWLQEQRGLLPVHERFMRLAIGQAKKAAALGETPVGCVIVSDGKVIGRGYNRRNTEKSVLAHAEITAIRKACRALGDWRLEGCTLYVTLEPCPMCAGAIVQARIPQLVMGAKNPKAGCAGSVCNLLREPGLNHQVRIFAGVCETECSRLLSEFFRGLRSAGRPEAVDSLSGNVYTK